MDDAGPGAFGAWPRRDRVGTMRRQESGFPELIHRGFTGYPQPAPVRRSISKMTDLRKDSVTFVTVDDAGHDQRVDNFLLRHLKGVPKSHVYRILRSGEVRVNSKRVDQTYRLVEHDEIRIPPIRLAVPGTPAPIPLPSTASTWDACCRRGWVRRRRVRRRWPEASRMIRPSRSLCSWPPGGAPVVRGTARQEV